MKISFKKFKVVLYSLFGIIVTVIIGGSIFPITVPLDEVMINERVGEKIPIETTKQFSVPLTKKTIDIDTVIDEAEVDIVSNVIYANANGMVSYGEYDVRFKVEARGANIQYDKEKYAFYFKPDSIYVTLDDGDVAKLIETMGERIESIPEEEVINEKKSLLGRMISKAKDKTAEAVSNGKAKDFIVDNLTSAANYTAVKALNAIPVYRLKDRDADNVAKVFLSGVDIEEGELKIRFSMVNILHSILKVLGVIALFALLILWVTESVKKRGKWNMGFIEVAAEGVFGGAL